MYFFLIFVCLLVRGEELGALREFCFPSFITSQLMISANFHFYSNISPCTVFPSNMAGDQVGSEAVVCGKVSYLCIGGSFCYGKEWQCFVV